MAIQNYASKYAKQVDERFSRESQVMLALSNDYKFTGVKTVQIYSVPVVAMGDYNRAGSSRYGAPDDLSTSTRTYTVGRDRAFTFIIDKGDKLQSQMVTDAGKALARQLREVCVPEFDAYVFKTLAAKAVEAGAYDATAAGKDNAYELLLKGMEYLGDHNVPDKGRVCFCTYRFANLLKQDAAFMRYGDASQEMLLRGVIGEVDGCKIVKVPASRLPAGACFLLVHPSAATAPKQLEDYKIHDNPPGISGWLVEGRLIYDCFVLGEKADAIYYHGGQSVLKKLRVMTTATAPGKTTILVTPDVMDGSKRYYAAAVNRAGLPGVTFGTALDTSAWTEMTTAMVKPEEGAAVVRVAEVDESGMPLAVGDAELHVG